MAIQFERKLFQDFFYNSFPFKKRRGKIILGTGTSENWFKVTISYLKNANNAIST